MHLKRVATAALAGLLAASAVSTARADEGMWAFDNVPKADIKRKYGVEVTDAWLKHVQLASVRFNNGGSGSFVSADGLVMTNHHVASDVLQHLSTPERDLFKTGFHARTREEEAPAPSLELNVLVSTEDVTARVNSAVKADTGAADANAARRAAIAEIEKASLAETGLRSDVVTLYQGGLYHLYRYKKYTDVRLVFAPEFNVAFFGGDPDNFTYPRYCLDLALFRVYEDGKPVSVEHYFQWSKSGSKAGDAAFVSGHPGSTQRLFTMAHLEFLRDEELPYLVRLLQAHADVLKRYGGIGEEQERQAHDELFGVMNSLKAYKGRLDGLRNEALMARKRSQEKALRDKVSGEKRMREAYAEAWDDVAKARRSMRSYNARRRMIDAAHGFDSELFWYARMLVRLPVESAKPNSERLKEYTDAGRASLEQKLFSEVPVYGALEQVKLAHSLATFEKTLGASDPTVKRVLDGKTPEARARELVEGSRLGDAAFRKQLADGGIAAVEASTDPMVRLARSVDAESRELRRRYEDEVIGVERGAYARIARAVFDVEGTSVYPDATFTLRLSYGSVKGYSEGGAEVAPYTTIAGMFERSERVANKAPYQLPERWLKAKERLDLSIPFNFVTTNDIIGGNSGSPVLNREAEVIGLVFDGNIQSLVGAYVYNEADNRTVSVDSRAIIEVLSKVYEAKELVGELVR